MDLQTRKLNLIAYLSQIQDEKFIEKIEKFILRKQESEPELKPFSVEELIQRIEKSENDFKRGNFKTQEELEKSFKDW
jgi:hypothetical protein